MRVAVAAVLVAALVPLVASTAGADPTAGCRTKDSGRDVEAVFGHFATRAAAERYRALVESRGFKGFTVEDDGCGDFELASDDIAEAQRPAFALEAAQSHLQVSWEQAGQPDRRVAGHVLAVFGTRRTLTAANALAWQVAGYGFRYIDIAYAPGAWRVVQPGIPIAQEPAVRAEVRRTKHLTVTFATH